MLMKGTTIAAMATVIIFMTGCAVVETGADRTRSAAIGVGEKVEYHAQKVQRKTRSFWHWLFGGGERTSQARPRKKKHLAEPAPTEPATQLPNYPQQYVGREN